MHDKAKAAPFEDDDLYEQAVLRRVLAAQPTILRLCANSLVGWVSNQRV